MCVVCVCVGVLFNKFIPTYMHTYIHIHTKHNNKKSSTHYYYISCICVVLGAVARVNRVMFVVVRSGQVRSGQSV